MRTLRGVLRRGTLTGGVVLANVLLGVKIIGLTYGSFSWTTLSEAGEVTLYPAIRALYVVGNRATVSVQGVPGTRLRLQRTASLSVTNWLAVGTTVTAGVTTVDLVDSNAVPPLQFYRATQTSTN